MRQGSKIALVGSYLRVPQAAGQVEILILLVKINCFPIYANKFCDAGQVPILRYFEACWVTLKGKNMLPMGSISFPLMVAHFKMWFPLH